MNDQFSAGMILNDQFLALPQRSKFHHLNNVRSSSSSYNENSKPCDIKHWSNEKQGKGYGWQVICTRLELVQLGEWN